MTKIVPCLDCKQAGLRKTGHRKNELCPSKVGKPNLKSLKASLKQESNSVHYGAMGAEWHEKFVEQNPFVYHVAPKEFLESILENGLLPASEAPVHRSKEKGSAPSQLSVIYAGDKHNAEIGFLNDMSGVYGEDAVVIEIDTSMIARNRYVPDEDTCSSMTGFSVDPLDFGVERPSEGEADADWAERVKLGSQEGIIEAAWEDRQTIGILGTIPPEAIKVSRVVEEREERIAAFLARKELEEANS